MTSALRKSITPHCDLFSPQHQFIRFSFTLSSLKLLPKNAWVMKQPTHSGGVTTRHQQPFFSLSRTCHALIPGPL